MAKYHGKRHYLGAWKYVLLDILYAIPVIGLIFLLVHAFNHNHENRLHYARSYFVRLLLVVIVCAVVVGALYLTLGAEAFFLQVNEVTKTLTETVETLDPGALVVR